MERSQRVYPLFLYIFIFICALPIQVKADPPINYSQVTPSYWPEETTELYGFPVQGAEALFSEAFTQISEKYMNPVAVDVLAIDGLNAVSKFIPEVVTHAGERVLIHKGTDLLASYERPLKNDALGWGRLMAASIAKMRQHSPVLQQMNTEQIYYFVLNYILGSLDPGSKYIHAHRVSRLKDLSENNASVGLTYRNTPEGSQVLRVYPDSPAFVAGINEGDLITHVYGNPVAEMSQETIEDHLYGKPNSIVTLSAIDYVTRLRKDISLRRVSLVPSSVTLSIEDNVAVITIHSFNEYTKPLMEDVLREIRTKLGDGPEGLIIDLRGNFGGDLYQTVALLNIFIDNEEMFFTKGRHPESQQIFQATAGAAFKNTPIVIIVDQTAASSAEIFAAVLQDKGRAVVIGTPSHGKGTIQTKIPLPNNAQIMLTWAKGYTLSGHLIDGLGVLPAVCASTIENEDDIRALMNDISRGLFQTPIHTWRALDEKNEKRRQMIREGCPAVYPSNARLSFWIKIAKAILKSPKAYQHLIDLSVQAES